MDEWLFTKTDQEWATVLEAELTAARRDDLDHGTNAAYAHGCVCGDCREHQQRRMGRIGVVTDQASSQTRDLTNSTSRKEDRDGRQDGSLRIARCRTAG